MRRDSKKTIADPDGDLIARIADGESKAASLLIERHLTSIAGLARNILGDACEAEDVAQEVFLRVWVHAGKWKPGKAKFATWMHRVTINLCYDKLRKKKEIYMDVLPEQVDEQAQSAELLVDEGYRSRQVRLALATLAPRQRVAIVLCHLHELGNIEAAHVMDISIEALESLLARGRRALRVRLAGQIEELLGE